MALSIKSEEADRLARELAAETGESLTDAVILSLRERLARRRALRGRALAQRVARLQEEVAALPVRDGRQPDAILGYDDDGLPS
jgi:antitoxin VapB